MVRVTDVKGGLLNLEKALLVSQEIFDEFTKRHHPQKGDIVFARVGSFGNVSYVSNDTPFCLGQNTAIITPDLNSRYLHYALQAPHVKVQMERTAVGTSQKTISLKSINALKIPVPSLEEQAKILDRLNHAMANIAEVEAVLASSEAELTQLDQSILAKAFRGELVPQDPGDEPASQLLHRIRTTREKLDAEKKAAKTAKKAKKKVTGKKTKKSTQKKIAK